VDGGAWNHYVEWFDFFAAYEECVVGVIGLGAVGNNAEFSVDQRWTCCGVREIEVIQIEVVLFGGSGVDVCEFVHESEVSEALGIVGVEHDY